MDYPPSELGALEVLIKTLEDDGFDKWSLSGSALAQALQDHLTDRREEVKGERPEWLHCIGHPGDSEKSACGSDEYPFFQDLDHALNNYKKEGRLVACSFCLCALINYERGKKT